MDPTTINCLTPKQKSLLQRGNLHDLPKIMLSSTQDIAQKCKIPLTEAQELIDALYILAEVPRLHQLDHIRVEGSELSTTGDPLLDSALGGGIRSGMVWEVAGESASGKTQLALQLSLFIQLPNERGGRNGATCYITTSSTIPTNRLVQIMQTNPALLESECDLKDIHTISTPTIPILIHVLSERISSFVKEKLETTGLKPVKLLVIDALAELFHSSSRTTTTTLVDRSRSISQISALLHALAKKHSLAIVVLNEVIDAFDRNGGPDRDDSDLLYHEQARWFSRAHSIPGESKKEISLGLVWANQVNTRILLSRTGRRRHSDELQGYPNKRMRMCSNSSAPQHSVPHAIEDLTLIRRLSIIFSSVSRPSSLDYIISEAGVMILQQDGSILGRDIDSTTSSLSAPAEATYSMMPCSQISPLDIGTAEERNSAQETPDTAIEEPEEDDYWALSEIGNELYDTL